MGNNIKKSIEMTDVKISYLSLVDKAANKTKFLVTKNSSGKPQVVFSSKIIKSENHKIVGIVYEPMAADAHDNFMSAEEIKKAAEWFNTYGLGADLQHNEVVQEGVTITKSYVLEEDTTINGQVVKAGTWVAEAEISNDEIWSKIEKGEITGWSMGGEGTYVMEDVKIDKNELADSIVSKLLKAMDKVEKGVFTNRYTKEIKFRSFWTAFDTLQSILYPNYDNLESDPEVIREALTEFNTVITEILNMGNEEILKSLEPENKTSNDILKAYGTVAKAGKKLSAANKQKLEAAYTSIGELLNLDNEEGEEIMKAEDIKAIAAEVATIMKAEEQPAEESIDDKIAKAVEVAMGTIKKDLGVEEEQPESLEDKVAKAVAKAMEPIYAKRGITKQLDTEVPAETKKVTKSYMDLFNGGEN